MFFWTLLLIPIPSSFMLKIKYLLVLSECTSIFGGPSEYFNAFSNILTTTFVKWNWKHLIYNVFIDQMSLGFTTTLLKKWQTLRYLSYRTVSYQSLWCLQSNIEASNHYIHTFYFANTDTNPTAPVLVFSLDFLSQLFLTTSLRLHVSILAKRLSTLTSSSKYMSLLLFNPTFLPWLLFDNFYLVRWYTFWKQSLFCLQRCVFIW